MRLLNTDSLQLKEFCDDEVPQYAILSHTWDEEEVTFQDIEGTPAMNKKGYEKIKNVCSIARRNGFRHVWIDTCCINKTSSAELSEAINSMYRWYQEAEVCYAYLSDVPWKSEFQDSRWFTRGWTLQELIAPLRVIFFDGEWGKLGTKETLRQRISDCTGIPIGILSGDDDLETVSIAQRMSWAAKRNTSRIEDRAYCLLGVFGINMPLIYGERETAFIRLQEEIMRISDDHSLFAWKSPDNRGGLLATSPAAFISSSNIVRFKPIGTFSAPLTVSSRGVHLELRFIGIGRQGLGLAILQCKERDIGQKPIAIYMKDLFLTMDQFERVRNEEFEWLDLRKFKPSQYPMRRICIRKGRMTHRRQSKHLGNCDGIAPEEIYPEGRLTNLLNIGSRTDLFLAAERGLEDVVWLLLTRSDIETNWLDEHGQTALSHAASGGQEAVVRMLLGRSDIMVDLKDEDEATPLCRAANQGHEAIVQLLLDNGADIESKNEKGQTPLWRATEQGHEAIVRLLLENGADIESRSRCSDMSYYLAQTPLLCAAVQGHKAIVQLLLENGADIESTDLRGNTSLSEAAEEGHHAVVQLLLENGADIESLGSYRYTPLTCAASGGHETIVQLLLVNGANIESKTTLGETPLLCAAVRGHKAVVRQLLDKGADIKSKDRDGKTPLSCAVVQQLLDEDANTKSEDNSNRIALSQVTDAL